MDAIMITAVIHLSQK